MAQLIKYRLLPGTGKHIQGDNIYKAGDVVESEHDLVKNCENKFERLHDAVQEFTAPNVEPEPASKKK